MYGFSRQLFEFDITHTKYKGSHITHENTLFDIIYIIDKLKTINVNFLI